MKYGKVRIIGGQWRSRKLLFPELPGLRPTTDRNRETLFNWLAPFIQGARCLDLFAGSGALGFEALSRGASFTLFVDHAPIVIKHLSQQFHTFQLSNDQAQTWLAQIPYVVSTKMPLLPFDIIFLDPPFGHNLIKPCCDWLITHQLLCPNAIIYIEMETELKLSIPSGWEILRNKKAGQTAYYLLQATHKI